jgi:hypothetical protein
MQQVASVEGVFEKTEDRPYPLDIERHSSLMSNTPNVLHIFRAAGEHLGNDEILRTDHRNRRTAHVDGNGALQEVLFEAGAGQNYVHRHPRALVDERKNASALDEIGIVDHEIEAMSSHGGDERFDTFDLQVRGDISVGAQTRTTPDDCSLGTEEIPPQTSLGHDGGESVEELSDCPIAGHDEGSPIRARARRDRRAGRLPSASRLDALARSAATRRQRSAPRLDPFGTSAPPSGGAYWPRWQTNRDRQKRSGALCASSRE